MRANVLFSLLLCVGCATARTVKVYDPLRLRDVRDEGLVLGPVRGVAPGNGVSFGLVGALIASAAGGDDPDEPAHHRVVREQLTQELTAQTTVRLKSGVTTRLLVEFVAANQAGWTKTLSLDTHWVVQQLDGDRVLFETRFLTVANESTGEVFPVHDDPRFVDSWRTLATRATREFVEAFDAATRDGAARHAGQEDGTK
jgi:hypothetical protein